MTSELDRIKSRGYITLWNSEEVVKSSSIFAATNSQLTAKLGIEPVKLRLDDVGYNYQNVFVAALLFATVFGLGSSFVGGQLGFILGYASALVPIVVVGIGSIAPALLGDIINRSRYALCTSPLLSSPLIIILNCYSRQDTCSMRRPRRNS